MVLCALRLRKRLRSAASTWRQASGAGLMPPTSTCQVKGRSRRSLSRMVPSACWPVRVRPGGSHQPSAWLASERARSPSMSTWNSGGGLGDVPSLPVLSAAMTRSPRLNFSCCGRSPPRMRQPMVGASR